MTLPSYLTKKEDSPSKKGRNQEKIARQTINSGTTFFDKSDLEVKDSNDEYRVDVKKVVKQKSFRFSLQDIDKFYKQSAPQTPVYVVYIGDYVLKTIVKRL